MRSHGNQHDKHYGFTSITHTLLLVNFLKVSAMAESDVKLDDFANIFSLDGKVAVVTGGSRGLGLHAASGFVDLSIFNYSTYSVKLPSIF